jgi:hypothetical protein
MELFAAKLLMKLGSKEKTVWISQAVQLRHTPMPETGLVVSGRKFYVQNYIQQGLDEPLLVLLKPDYTGYKQPGTMDARIAKYEKLGFILADDHQEEENK